MTRELRFLALGILLGLFFAWSMACTAMLPMTDRVDQMDDFTAARIALATGLTAAQVKDPIIHEVHEVKVPCSEMLRLCTPSVPWYLMVLGSVPLACTTLYQQPWAEKVAIIHYCWMTDPLTMAHEREHATGATHKYW